MATAQLLYVNFLNLHKSRTVQQRTNPFDEFDDDKFRERFRITKGTALRLLAEVSCDGVAYVRITYVLLLPCDDAIKRK